MNDRQLKVSYKLIFEQHRVREKNAGLWDEMLPKIIEFLTYETEFVLFSAVLEKFVLPAG